MRAECPDCGADCVATWRARTISGRLLMVWKCSAPVCCSRTYPLPASVAQEVRSIVVETPHVRLSLPLSPSSAN